MKGTRVMPETNELNLAERFCSEYLILTYLSIEFNSNRELVRNMV
jgi:hypothetical protein